MAGNTIKVNSVVKIKQTAVKQITKAIQTSLEQTAEALHTAVDDAQVMPRDMGTLQNTTFVDSSEIKQGRVKLVSSTPYARRLYFHPEYHFSTTENPNARGKWYDDWINGSQKEFCPRAFAALLKRNGGF